MQTTKRPQGGIRCVSLKVALPNVADNKKKFTNKNASSLQSNFITNRIRVCARSISNEDSTLKNNALTGLLESVAAPADPNCTTIQ